MVEQVAPEEAATLTRGSARPGVNEPGRRQEDDWNLVAETAYYVGGAENGTLRANGGEDSKGRAGNRSDMQPMVVVPGDAMGFGYGVSSDGAEEGVAPTLAAGPDGTSRQAAVVDAAAFLAGGSPKVGGIGYEDEVSPTLTSEDNGSTRTPTVVYTKGHASSDQEEDPESWREDDTAKTLHTMGHAPTLVVQDEQSIDDPDDEVTAFAWQQGDDSGQTGTGRGRSWVARAGDYTGALSHTRHDAVQYADVVRRLTPRECERLQGLPDDWTLLDEGTADGPRYAALGDAVTAPVAWWVGRRILRKLALRRVESAADSPAI